MKILMINKFLYPNGGSETYIIRLGEYWKSQGHEVQYFGMEHEGNCVGNAVNAYTSDMDFHGGSRLGKLLYPVKTIYSVEARKKLRQVLDDFQPDAAHLNNFNYQLTPSILLELDRWKKQGHPCRVVYTAHDYQLVCPNHMLLNPNTETNCVRCLEGSFLNCVKGKCIHGSAAKSAVGAAEAIFWNWKGVYRILDDVVCCSRFVKEKLDHNPVFAPKTIALHNFVDVSETWEGGKKDYVLYFGRLTREKGVAALLEACRKLPEIPFVIAGNGPMEGEARGISNVRFVGFQRGEALEKLIREARFSVCPSEWYENCPFSVMESLAYLTPVLGADIGGIPELIEDGVTGELYESGNVRQLTEKIERLWHSPERMTQYSRNCRSRRADSVAEYAGKLMTIYHGRREEVKGC